MIERALDAFKQWIMGVISDSKIGICSDGPYYKLLSDSESSIESASVLGVCNKILQSIFGDDRMSFVWLGRKSAEKVAIRRGNSLAFRSLNALSAGQVILLGMFGTLLRYGDLSQNGSNISLSSIGGICVIDEIDSHMHIDLQNKIIPELIELFPKIQFIISNHSPLFVLGMERVFGADGIQVIDMPKDLTVGAETYAEFGRALEALSASHAFTERIINEARSKSKPIVYVEGETDAPYLRRAAELLGRSEILDNCAIEWIGSKDKNGQGFHTGKDALKHTLSVIKANPNLINRQVLLLYDNDLNTPDQGYDRASIRTLPINKKNKVLTAGIENFLAEECITSDFYETKASKKPNGDITLRKTLRKADLCRKMCSDSSIECFSAFIPALDIIGKYLVSCPSLQAITNSLIL